MSVDEKSPYLELPLPQEANRLDQDLPRLRAAFSTLDSHAQKSDAALLALNAELESKSCALEAQDEALRATLASTAAELVAHFEAENPHHIPTADRVAAGLVRVGEGIEVEQGVISVPVAVDSTPGLMRPDNLTCAVDAAGMLFVTGDGLAFAGYLTEFRSFFEQSPPPGWAVRNGAVLENARVAYPELWAALHAEQNAWKCKSLEGWAALSAVAGGCGGVPFFVLDEDAETIKLPDTRGDYERGAGSGYLETVGAWHGDAVRNASGNVGYTDLTGSSSSGAFSNDAFRGNAGIAQNNGRRFAYVTMSLSRQIPTASEIRTRTFGMLPCVYIGGDH